MTKTIFLFNMIIFLLIALQGASAEPAPQNTLIKSALDEFNASATYRLPQLSVSQLEALDSGRVVTILDRQGGSEQPRRATGLLKSTVDRDLLWLACQDLHFQIQEQTKELRISLDGVDKAQWYGFIDLPWPFNDRHWVVDVRNNHSLAQKTNNRAWEHSWTLVPQEKGVDLMAPQIRDDQVKGVTHELFDSAIYTPVNHGAWVAIDLGNEAIFGYHTTTVVGGNIPESTISHFVYQGLEKLLIDIESRASQQIPSHYVSGHGDVIIDGAGQPIPFRK
jgi:hypothetical protein